MTSVSFITGFPGFIATRLLKKIARLHPFARFELLVHPSQFARATQELDRLVADGASPRDRYRLIQGDITANGLGLGSDDLTRLRRDVTHVFHLAALYDLAVPQDIAYRVNVIGTDHVNDFVRSLTRLQRYTYFSTAYVSGDRTGRIYESELDCGQSFKNHYEATKFAAEVNVQALREDVPLTIIRPGIVMGDSRTGETAKFDGPYFIMRFLDRLRALPVPYVGAGAAHINLVPVDYIIDATAHLAYAQEALDRVYHLTHPNPCSARETYEMICTALLGKKPTWTLPASLVEASLSLSALRRFVRVEKETIAYFSHLADYDATGAQQDLLAAGIHCPSLHEFLQPAVDYYIAHRTDPDKRIPVR